MAQKRLMQELNPLQREKWLTIRASRLFPGLVFLIATFNMLIPLQMDDSNMFKWCIGLWVVNPDSVFYGAYLRSEMRFPHDYPYQPPTFRFVTQGITHPNVYPDGNLCISILHKPGDDEQSGELANERWNVLHGVESVLRSVLLLLDDPEINSPANVDASVLYRDEREKYDALAKDIVLSSQNEAPKGVRMPTQAELAPVPQKIVEDDDDFWNPSEEEEDFGGSDSDMDDFEEEEDDEEDDKE